MVSFHWSYLKDYYSYHIMWLSSWGSEDFLIWIWKRPMDCPANSGEIYDIFVWSSHPITYTYGLEKTCDFSYTKEYLWTRHGREGRAFYLQFFMEKCPATSWNTIHFHSSAVFFFDGRAPKFTTLWYIAKHVGMQRWALHWPQPYRVCLLLNSSFGTFSSFFSISFSFSTKRA